MPPETISISPIYYKIRISGRLSQDRAEWFGMALTLEQANDGSLITALSGPVADQAALFGILNRIRDLGLRLISVNRIDLAQDFRSEEGRPEV